MHDQRDNHNISLMVDQLGRIKASMAELKEEEAGIKATLIMLGVEEAEGDLYRATIRQQIRRVLDTALIRKLVPKALLRRAEKEVSSTVVRVTARKGVILSRAA